MNPIHLLVVDDDPWILRMVSSTLKTRNYVVETAKHGREALELARRNKPDLVITDVMMPEMDGQKLVSEMRADPSLQSVPVLYLTALGKDEGKLRSMGLAPEDYITKPFRFDDLEKRVHAAVNGTADGPSGPSSDGPSQPHPPGTPQAHTARVPTQPNPTVGPPAGPGPYGQPPPGYGYGQAPPPGYGQPPPPGYGYGQPPPPGYGYGQPPPGYPPMQPGYGYPPGYGHPAPGYPAPGQDGPPMDPGMTPPHEPQGVPAPQEGHDTPDSAAPGDAGSPNAEPHTFPGIRRKNSGLRGRLEQLGLSSLLVMLEMERKDGLLLLKNGEDDTVARFFLRRGQVIQARVEKRDDLDGRQSVYAALAWTKGKFSFSAMEVDMDDEIQSTTTGLLMEGARIMDEDNR